MENEGEKRGKKEMKNEGKIEIREMQDERKKKLINKEKDRQLRIQRTDKKAKERGREQLRI